MNFRRIKIATAAVVFTLAAGLSACGDSEDDAEGPGGPDSPVAQYLDDPAEVARGKSLFTGLCGAYCHKLTPSNTDAPYLFDCRWKHGGSDEQIFAVISNGVPETRMVPFGGALPEGDEDIWRIVAYLRSASTCGQ